jgi:hypothetical protein
MRTYVTLSFLPHFRNVATPYRFISSCLQKICKICNYTIWPLPTNAELRCTNNMVVTAKCAYDLGSMIFCAQYGVRCRNAGCGAGKRTLPPPPTMWVFRRVYYARHDSRFCALSPVLCLQMRCSRPSHHRKYSLLVRGSLCSCCHGSNKSIALSMEEKVAKASLKGPSGNDPDTVNAIEDLIPLRRSEGRWREAKELQIKDIEASSKTLDAGHLNTLAAMETLPNRIPSPSTLPCIMFQ